MWSFGNCTFDERRLALSVGGEVVAAEARPLQLLVHLLHHAGELVTKDELIEAVWPGRIPSESVLTKTVAKLRQALRDEDQALIRTVYGQGYRLVAPVSVKAQAGAAPVDTPDFAPGLAAGETPPLRPHWVLREKLSSGGRNEVWLARHAKTGQPRVFKFARDADGLRALKREVTVFRLLREAPGAGEHLLEILDWNLDEPPWFIECPFIAGGNLAHWCEQGGGIAAIDLSLRLALIAQAADTLAAAHDTGVLHKDVKPGNVLVDLDAQGRPLVRLADFGSGRLIDLERLARLEITRLGFTQSLDLPGDDSSGTPLYLAPELLAGQPPTLRSDIYALGVMLYQIVAGDFRRPLAPGWERDVTDPLLCEDIRACADVDPARRLADARVLAQRLRDLAARREQQARAQAEQARTQQLQARLDRLRTRRPWLVASMLLLLLGLAVSTQQWLRANRANQLALRESALAAAVNRFLTDDLLAGADPLHAGRRDVRVSEVLARAQQQAATRFAGRPEQEAAVREAVGKAYAGLSDYDTAERELRQAMKLLDGLPQARARRDQQQLALIELLLAAEHMDVASREADALAARGPLAADTALGLDTARAWLDFRAGNHARAISAMEALRGRHLALAAEQPERTQAFLQRLGEAYVLANRGKEAIEVFGDLLKRQTALYGQRDARLVPPLIGLGQGFEWADRNEEALPLLERAASMARETLGEEHDLTLTAAGELAGVYETLQRFDAAEAEYQRLLAILRRRFGEDYLITREITSNLGVLYDNMGRSADALPLFEQLYEREKRIGGESHPDTLNAAHNVGNSLSRLKRWDEALRWQRRTWALASKALPADNFQRGVMQYKLAESQSHLGQTAQARENFDQAIAFLQRTLGDEHRWTRKAIEVRDNSLGEAHKS
ncbi:MAG TPA: tetratricopeptide repeat protein [Ideonella sp.]|uniref:tetratricopeptide repeat protein n=1 Tax=Ideonella sp. TaxID=1929293 RepID=UPI002C2F59CC|nr:tetratricopeptide repeat protein [Ideonella sp.]HSI46948.1 tetratricopeptide repeat protein [Ideonella sp.]